MGTEMQEALFATMESMHYQGKYKEIMVENMSDITKPV
jgi:hypothetical protein